MKYGFVIDQRKCIGCHACTVACKSEHDVPIGVYRTWVKYIEKGEFPNSRRYFLVNRCNHCNDAPCVTICPTRALYKRDDGIVDFDARRCIGCKSCMQACPYDALYIDPSTQTAAKCNYCAHRTEVGLEPACVTVCPERAIIAGDMHNPQSEIARLIAREPVRVRKPEKGTGPNVYYLGADETTINPEAAYEDLPHMTMWSTILTSHHERESAIDASSSLRPDSHLQQMIDRPLTTIDREPREAHIVYDTPKNRAPWGWKVSAYLGTKSLGAGAMLVAAILLTIFGQQIHTNQAMSALIGLGAPVIGGFFLALTLVLLIADLKRPDRALFLVTKANMRSWLVWGGYILGGLGLFEAAWFGLALFGLANFLFWLLIPTALFAAAAAGYTAFLFGQAQGRDFWQSPLLLPLLLVQAVLAGSAALAMLVWLIHADSTISNALTLLLSSFLTLHTLLVLLEMFAPHRNTHVATATRYIKQGGLRTLFWGLFFTIGSLLPLAGLYAALTLPIAQLPLLGISSLLALVGLFAYEHCFVTAGQIVPLS